MNWNEISAFSTNGEYWSCDIEVVYDYCQENLDKGDEFTIEIGDQHKLTHDDFFHPKQLACLVEQLQEQAYEKVGDIAEVYLEHFASSENEKEFKQMISNWIQSKTGDVNVWQVKNAREVKCVWDGREFKEVK